MPAASRATTSARKTTIDSPCTLPNCGDSIRPWAWRLAILGAIQMAMAQVPYRRYAEAREQHGLEPRRPDAGRQKNVASSAAAANANWYWLNRRKMCAAPTPAV